MTEDRIPPHSPEAEVGVLGCLLLSPMECVPQAVCSLSTEHFYDIRNRTVFEGILALWNDSRSVDLVLLVNWLRDRHQLDDAGGIEYVAPLADRVPSAAMLPEYSEVLQNKLTLRRILAVASRHAGKVFDQPEDAQSSLEAFERDCMAIRREASGEAKTAAALVQEAINEIEASHLAEGKIRGIATGFADLDREMDGLRPGEMTVLAARPSVGKTSLALNIAEHVALGGAPVGILTAEMTPERLMLRLVYALARVDCRERLTEGNMSRLLVSTAKLSKAPIHIVSVRGNTVAQVRAKARRMTQQHSPVLYVVDYLQLLSAGRHCNNRNELVTEISNGLYTLAGECNAHVLALSQLNREVTKDDRTPRLSDLRDSGSIEQDADSVWLLHPSGDGEVTLLIPKQRNGPTGSIKLAFIRQWTRFENAAKITEADLPRQYVD